MQNFLIYETSIVHERTSIINKYKYSICRLLINYKFLDRWNTRVKRFFTHKGMT